MKIPDRAGVHLLWALLSAGPWDLLPGFSTIKALEDLPTLATKKLAMRAMQLTCREAADRESWLSQRHVRG